MIEKNSIQTELKKLGAEYLNISIEEFSRRMKNNAALAEEDWKNKNSLEDFYKTTEAYIYGLVEFCEQERVDNILFPLRQFRGARILDYGAGIGIFTILLSNLNNIAYYYDFESKTKDFAKFIVEKTRADVNFIEDEKKVFDNKYDIILCLDVLEHVENPMELVKKMTENLESGKLFVTTGLDFSTSQSMHLEENLKYKEEFHKYIDKHFYTVYFHATKYEFLYVFVKKGEKDD